MVSQDNVKILWDDVNGYITIQTTEGNEIVINSGDTVAECEGGFITANVSEVVLTDMKRVHVKQYFDNDINGRIINLPLSARNKFFKMLHENAVILSSVFPSNGFPIIEHILGIPWAAAENNPHPGINFEYQCKIIELYEEWKAAYANP